MIAISPSPLADSSAISIPALTRFLNRARAAIGLPGAIDVLLTTDAELKRLNRTFRGNNKPTDVLSFPSLSEIHTNPGLPPEAAAHAHSGDLAISLDTATRQAAHFGHTLDVELRILLLHGLLHLVGHDHETDSGEMAALESSLRALLKLPSSLIARALSPTPNPGAPHLSSERWERGATTAKPKAPATQPKPRGRT